MDRLTESDSKMPLSEIRRILERGEWWENVRDVSPDEPCPWLDELNDAIEAALEKLAAYEYAEERGLIVRLPCPIGERVYAVNGGYYCEFPDAETTCEAGAKYRACEYYSSGGCEAPLYDHTLELGVRTKPFEYTDIPNVGKTVFLTSAEAEAALQARNGGGGA